MMQVFCAEDIVSKISNDTILGVIERTHGDVDTHDPHPGRTDRIKCDKDIRKPAFTKFMKDGVPPKDTVLVRWQESSSAQLILESKLSVVDRSLLVGDVVKKNVRDAMSGVIINTFTKCTLQPISEVMLSDNGQSSSIAKLKGLPPSTKINHPYHQASLNKTALIRDVPTSELRYAHSPTAEDLVIYKGWIGRVEDVNCMISLRLSDNCVVDINDDVANHLDGTYDAFTIGDIVTSRKAVLRTGIWIYGKYNPNTMPVGTVVQVRPISADVTWLERRIGIGGEGTEPPATLERTELESREFEIYDRTKRPQRVGTGSELCTVSNSEIDVRLNQRVRFKDLSGACVKYDGSNLNGRVTRIDQKDNLGYDLNVFEVSRFQTDVTVQWQDLSITQEKSIHLIPEIAIDDDHDAWPGEIAHPLDLELVPSLSGVKQARKVGVIQSVNAFERMAEIAWCPSGCVQYSEDLIDAPGLRGLVTGVVGVATGGKDEVSLYDVEAPGEMNVRRGDIVILTNPASKSKDSKEDDDQDWLGEIVDTRLDGLLTVRLGAANPVRDVNLRREDVAVAIRSDMSDEVDAWANETLPQVRINSDGEMEVLNDSEDESEDDTDNSGDDDGSLGDFLVSSSDEENVTYENENGEPMDLEDVENEDWESDFGNDDDIEMADSTYRTPLTSPSATPSSVIQQKVEAESIPGITNGVAPEPYFIFDQPVPTNHAFSTRPSTDNAAHTKRTQKEHKILRSPFNLPQGVYVRTWESRLDLLRVLFVGPEETPYANAPFIADFYLPPNFPSEPPQAFFHSFTVEGGLGGVGRVNPNLYEDGKICLSLLGTWESGKGSEGWNAGRSTILQVLVSLLGLVLVKEPYFNEAGYEHLAGMESAKRASELYNERAFLKARTFVLAALTKTTNGCDSKVGMGIEGLEDVLDWLYRASNGPRLLEKCIDAMKDVLKRSEHESEGEGDDNVLPAMSRGACISLRRVLERFDMLR